ncbi:hypothetical protein Tco_1148762 [Tanacetum coccineum]
MCWIVSRSALHKGHLVVCRSISRWSGLQRVGFSTWMTFGGNTHDLGLFGEETDEITGLHQILEEVLLTEHGDGIASIKRRRRDLSGDDVWTLTTASQLRRLKVNL